MKRHLTCIALFLVLIISASHAQGLKLHLGTDIPYQFYTGVTLETKKLDYSYRTGILVPPYSNAILNVLEAFGADQVYIDILDASYDFGWMNSLGAYYKFGKEAIWYTGLEMRFDLLTVADSPAELIETTTGTTLRTGNLPRQGEARLGINTFALSFRLGRKIKLGDRHTISPEISFGKYLASNSSLTVNGRTPAEANQRLDEFLWEDVFKPYGYLGGIGVMYSFSL